MPTHRPGSRTIGYRLFSFAISSGGSPRPCYQTAWGDADASFAYTRRGTILSDIRHPVSGRTQADTSPDAVRAAVERLSGLAGVRFAIDGRIVVGGFALDRDEHHRRLQAGIGAVTSAALLHGLWMLPTGGHTPPVRLPEIKVQRLRAAPRLATETSAGFVRTYQPPGFLRSAAFYHKKANIAVSRAARFTPIFQRFALFDERRSSVSARVKATAREWGVGLVHLLGEHELEVLLDPMPAVTGVPAVYRWWIAELAYEIYTENSTDRRCGGL